MNENSILRNIPKVDEIISRLHVGDAPQAVVREAVREVLEALRESILTGGQKELPHIDAILEMAEKAIGKKEKMSLRPVINATGIILHTNLGRARMGETVARTVMQAAQGYSTLEYDIEKGVRGSRYTHVEKLLTRLSGAEAAMVVNNNAAALMLILNTLANKKEVVISRGELIEIGDSFRIPEIMKASGSMLAEVGTTNRTHLFDYENAMRDETAALLRAHTSNYRVVGFTESPTLKELVSVGAKYGVPVVHDIGSSTFENLEKYAIFGEPSVRQSLSDGVDVVCFSGDKLLGGPQAGVIAGKKKYIDLMKKNQLTRALRIDKMTLTALEATLRIYLQETAGRDIPTVRMIAENMKTLHARADALCAMIIEAGADCTAKVAEDFSQIGGGSVPGQKLPTAVVSVHPNRIPLMELESRIRLGEPPVIARICQGRLLLDVRTLEESELPVVAACIAKCAGCPGKE